MPRLNLLLLGVNALTSIADFNCDEVLIDSTNNNTIQTSHWSQQKTKLFSYPDNRIASINRLNFYQFYRLIH